MVSESVEQYTKTSKLGTPVSGKVKEQLSPTPTTSAGLKQRISDFETLSQALDYAAQGEAGINFYSGRGDLEYVVPYSELRSRARDYGRKLLGLGLERGDRIGLVAHMGPEFIALFFACQYAGLMAVPLPAVSGLGGRDGYEGQLSRILKKSESKMAIGPENVQESLKNAASELDLMLIGTAEDIQGAKAIELNLEPLSKDDISHIQFSSGSTRHPLGVVISQSALMANAYSIAHDALKVHEGDRVASWLPFYHDMGLIGFMIVPVTTQMSIDYLQTDGFARRPLLWLNVISDNKCTMAFSPTFGYELCTRRAARQSEINLDLSNWRVAGIGGEMIQAQTMTEFTQTFSEYGFKAEAFVPSYGLAEATLAFSFTPLSTGVQTDWVDRDALVDEQLAKKPSEDIDPAELDTDKYREFALCGVPLPGYEMEIRNEEGRILEDREIGSVFIKGPSLMDEYDKDTKATNAVLNEQRDWLNTGDMGYTIDGSLVVTGRAKDLIIVNGRNIWPQDLEWHVEDEIADLRPRDTAAFAMDDGDKGEKAVMLIQCRSQDQQTQDRIVSEAQAAIFKNAGIPCQIVLVPSGSLPFTTSGKLSRNRARKNYKKGSLRDIREAA